MPLLNDTTSVPVDHTVGEIQQCLAAHGAKAMWSEDDDTGKVIALSCNVNVGHHDIAFRLPLIGGQVLKR